ncbi:MAG TPA: GAF domain-containing protein [Geobacteraceae bacterium]|nr:GAF domain-containing protein [Geobacteraceae bacterium]
MPDGVCPETKEVFDYINEFLSVSDFNDLLDKICEDAPRIINGKECSIFLKHDHVKDHVKEYNGQLEKGDGTLVPAEEFIDSDFIVLVKTTREDFKEKIGKAFYCKGEGVTGWIYEKRKPLQIKDLQDREELKRIDEKLEWKDVYRGSRVHFSKKSKKPFIGVPMVKGDDIIGVMRVGEPIDGDSFVPGSQEKLMSLARILTNSIEKVTTENNLKDSLNSLIKIGAMRNGEEIFQAVVNEAKSLVGAENCELYYLDKDGERIVLRATTGGYMASLLKDGLAKPYERGRGLTGWVFKTGKPLRTRDISHFAKEQVLDEYDLDFFSDGPEVNDDIDRKIRWSDMDEQYKNHSRAHPYFLGVPIKSEINEVIGVLRASSPRTKTFFEKQDMELLQDFASYISVIFHNERQNRLYDVLIEIGNKYTKKELFEYVVDEIPSLVFGKGCSIFLKEKGPDSNDVIALRYTSSYKLKDGNGNPINLQYKVGEGKTGFVAEIKRSLLINYYGSGKIKSRKMEEDFREYSKKNDNLTCYLKNTDGNNVGIIRMFQRDGEAEFSETERKIFAEFCAQNIYEESGLPSNKQVKCETGASGYAQSFLAVPIKSKLKTGNLHGVIRIPRTPEGGRFSDEDIVLVESVAGRLTTVLEIKENLNILSDINSKINSSFDKDKILDVILESVTEKLGFEFACIQLVNRKENTIETVKVRKNSVIKDAIDPEGWLMASHSLYPPDGVDMDIHAYILTDLKREKVITGWDGHFDKEIYDRHNHEFLVRAFVPIIAIEPGTGEQVQIGTLEAGHNINRKNFIDDQELEMLKAVANQVAIAIWIREQIWSRVIYTISHQLRNHFTNVKVLMQAILAGVYGVLGRKQNEKLNVAIATIREQETMLTNFIELARILQDMASVNVKECDINALIRKVLDKFEYRVSAKRLNLISELDDNLKIMSDDSKIDQVLTNLIENAIKFTDKGAISVTAAREANCLKIVVSDTGRGIPEGMRDKIFLDFYRAHDKSEGTGLGLSIVKNYVKLLGGEIRVESEVGKGSKFILTLPEMNNKR